MPPIENKVTVTAGGVVINQAGQVLVVNQRGTSWSLPKGHVDPGEEPLDAAKREIKEESGVTDLSLVSLLNPYGRYKIGLNSVDEDKGEWKVLIFFLFKTSQTALKPLDPHNPEARWVNPDEIEAHLAHPKDRAFYKSIRALIK